MKGMRGFAAAGSIVAALALVACGGGESADEQASSGGGGCDGKIDGKQTLTAWFHTGTGPERKTFEGWIRDFNASQDQVTVKFKLLPEGNYNDQVKAAASSGDLPDLLDFDGPLLFNYAWNNNLKPLDGCVDDSLRGKLLPTLIKQGTYNGKLYGMGNGESGLGLYARRSVLERNNIRIPKSPDDAWTAEEFTSALKKLQSDGFKKPLDLQVNQNQGEWYSYGFAPIIQSAGADLINRKDYQSADGVLNSPKAVEALEVFQSWFKDELVDFNQDDAAFTTKRTPISWVGHWKFAEYSEALGDDLVVLPLPDFGQGTRTGEGSWQWGVTSKVEDTDAGWAFINFMLQPPQQRQIAKNGAIPANREVLESIKAFAPGGPEHMYVQQLEGGNAVPRPQTPAYPTITLSFNKAIQGIIDGADVKQSLDKAVEAIDQDIEDNEGYPIK